MINKLTIRVKILIILISISTVAVGISGYVAYIMATESLIKESFDKLTAVREMKANQIEDYFQQIVDQVITFSEDRMVIDAMIAFDEKLHAIDTELDISEDDMDNIDSRLKKYYQEEYLTRLLPNLDEQTSLKDYWSADKKTRILQDLYIASNPNNAGDKHLGVLWRLEDDRARVGRDAG